MIPVSVVISIPIPIHQFIEADIYGISVLVAVRILRPGRQHLAFLSLVCDFRPVFYIESIIQGHRDHCVDGRILALTVRISIDEVLIGRFPAGGKGVVPFQARCSVGKRHSASSKIVMEPFFALAQRPHSGHGTQTPGSVHTAGPLRKKMRASEQQQEKNKR